MRNDICEFCAEIKVCPKENASTTDSTIQTPDAGYWTVEGLYDILLDKVGVGNLEINGKNVIIKKHIVINTGQTIRTNVCRNIFMHPSLIESLVEATIFVLENEKRK